MEDIQAQRDPQTYAIIGSCMRIHTELKNGFREPTYHSAFLVECEMSSIPCAHEVGMEVWYLGQLLSAHHRVDFLCFNEIIVELKAVSQLSTEHEAQVLHYLKAMNKSRGLLINFGSPRLEYKRIVWNYQQP